MLAVSLFFVYLSCSPWLVSGWTVVRTPAGDVEGRPMISHHRHPFWGFQGIPYAEPPVGELRWLPPQPLRSKWNGTLDGSVSPPMCVQGFPDPETTHDSLNVSRPLMFGYEDCLILNIYTTDPQTEKLLPVLVWFHGGGLSTGQGILYGPHFLIEMEIVVVTVNYRLGPWGSFSLDMPTISGNQGLRDQVLALQWIQDNVEYFGGDSSKVTIGGESAGSWSVLHHLISPESNGLFRAVIGQSGTTISGMADRFMTREEAAENGRLFAAEVGCYDGDMAWDGDAVEECLRQRSVQELYAAHVTGTFSSRPNMDSFSMFPSLLPADPIALLTDGNFSRVPVLIGSNSGEGILNAGDYIKRPELLGEEFSDVTVWDEIRGPVYIFDRETRRNGSDLGPCDVQISRMARQFYFGEEITEDDLKQFINLNTDVQFWYGTDKLINLLVGKVPAVYHYILYFQDMFSFALNPSTLGSDLGVAHADELPYLFDLFGLNSGTGLYDIWWSEADQLNSDRMLRLWSNFVKELEPTPDLELGVSWQPVSQTSHQYLKIDRNLTMEMTQEYQDRINFWRTALESCKDIQKQ